MWRTARSIVSLALLSFAVSVGVAFAQNYNYPTTPQPSTPPSRPAAHAYTVNTASVTVKGKKENILTDARGMTLYQFTPDNPTRAACTAGCAKVWPPLLSKSTPTHPSSLPGKLSLVRDANGDQVSYNGHLLYRYSRDKTPGQTNGEGLSGKWFVATPDLAAAVPRGSSKVSSITTPGAW